MVLEYHSKFFVVLESDIPSNKTLFLHVGIFINKFDQLIEMNNS